MTARAVPTGAPMPALARLPRPLAAVLAAAFVATLAGAPARAASVAPAPPARAEVVQSDADSLYHALGRHAVLVPLMDDFIDRCAADARIGSFFDDVNLKELKKQLVDQVCQVADGPCTYEGASMADAHADLKIGRADFLAMVELLQQAMDRAGIAFALQRQLLARLAPMHREIVAPR